MLTKIKNLAGQMNFPKFAQHTTLALSCKLTMLLIITIIGVRALLWSLFMHFRNLHRRSRAVFSFSAVFLTSSAFAQEKPPVKTLETVTVRGTRLISEDMFIQQSSSAGNKDDTLLKDTPQSVSVVSQGQLKDQGAHSVQEATRYTAGVMAEVFGTDIRGDYVHIRGSAAGQFRDGMQTIFSANTTQARFPVFGLEKLEVLRGPSSMLYGQSPMGGLVNAISKIPRPESQGEVRYEMGSFNRHQSSIDLMGAASEDKTWSYRLVSQVRDSEAYVKHVRDDSVYFAPSLRWQPNRDTSLTLLVNYQRDDGVPSAQFVPADNSLRSTGLGKIRRDTYLGEPGFDEQLSEVRSLSILYDQAFNDVWSYHQNIRVMDTKISYQQIFRNWGAAVDPVSGNLDRTSYVYKSDTQSFKIDGHARARLANFAVPTTLMFGVDYQDGKIEADSGFAAQSAINVYNPVYGNYLNPELSAAPKYEQSQVGAYVQADLDLTETTSLIIGSRHDKAKTEGSSFDKVDSSATTSRAALVQEVAQDSNVYLSYAESFTPNQGVDRNNQSFDPRKGQQIEIGAKHQSSSFLGALAFFQTKETNRLTSDPLSTTFTSVAQGEVEINGAELELVYEMARGLSGSLSYSLLKTEVTDSAVEAEKGKRLGQTPERMGSLWLNYAIDAALKVGAGLRHVGETWDGADSNKTEAYTLTDAVVSYLRGDWEFILNGNNLADKVYITSCRIQGDCFYGQGRTLTATTAYHF